MGPGRPIPGRPGRPGGPGGPTTVLTSQFLSHDDSQDDSQHELVALQFDDELDNTMT